MKPSRRRLVQSLTVNLNSLVAVALCAGAFSLLLGVAGNASAQTRDPVNPLDLSNPANSPIWPFASTSPWNMPIGSGAQYAPINLSIPFGPGSPPDISNWTDVPGNHEEYVVLTPTAPLTDIVRNNAGWDPQRNRCATNDPGDLLVRVPVPAGYVVPDVRPDTPDNSAAFLMPDRRTIIQTQPFTRCVAGGPGTSIVSLNYVDVYGDGRWGSHGGSSLSAIGGSIHVGELRPGKPVRHAISMSVDSTVVLAPCHTPADGSGCFRWPAYTADTGAAMDYGIRNTNPVPGMKMGALLAIPASTDINSLGLESTPGRMLAWTLQNYGVYIVDSTGGPSFYIDTDIGPNGTFAGSKEEEFNNETWPDSTPPGPFHQRVNEGDGTGPNHTFYPWTRDVQKLIQALHLVDNNGRDSIGGGGTPRQPLAPPLAKERFENDISALVGNPDSAWVEYGVGAAFFSDSTAHSSNTAGSSAAFTFTGTALSWIGLKCNVCGTASVSIDGGAATTVNTLGFPTLGSPGLTSQAVYTTPPLAAGTHTIVIAVTGNGEVFIDALDVTP